MQIILLEKVEKLGKLGDIIHVKDGYARNYLLPQKKALRASEKNKKIFESRKVEIEKENEEQKTEAQKIADKIKDISITLIRQASDQGQLYGSVSSRDISNFINENEKLITPKQVKLLKTIKTLGLFEVEVYPHPEIKITLKLNIARSTEEASVQISNNSIKEEDVFDKNEDIEAFRKETDSEDNEKSNDDSDKTLDQDKKNIESPQPKEEKTKDKE